MTLRRRASRLLNLHLMSDGRKSQVVLLDERRLDIVIQPKLYTSDLLDMVSSHFRLKEKQYFGIAFVDDTGHYNWLNLEKRVLDHEFPKKSGILVLHFAIRFYIETIGLLRDTPTVELFYLNARQAVFKGQIECDSETVFELAALVLQFSHGDFVSDEETRNELKKLPVIPTFVLKEHPSIGYCEDRVIQHYQKLAGTSQGLAIVNYMTIVEKVPTYGIHCYEVKDKKSLPWWLGISPKGIYLFDKNDKSIPRKIFLWKSLENLYYRDKKFSIEVHDPKRVVHTLSSFNLYEDAIREPAQSFDSLSESISDPTTQVSVSRRTFGAGNVNVHAWFAATPQLTKCIWSMAVSQHQFYLDRKQSKSHLPSARSMSEIAADLCRSTTSLPGSIGSDISRSTSSQSLPSLTSSRFDLNIEQADTLKAQREMYQALKARKEALEEALRKKTEDLKNLCFQEGELTGELPTDTPLEPGEKAPAFRRRVGTSFSLTKNLQESGNEREDIVAKLELEYELQSKITAAAFKLSQDKAVSKSVRKQRRQAYTRALNKLKDMEKKLSDMRRNLGLSCRVIQPTPGYNENEMFSPISPATSPPVYRAVSNRQHHGQGDGHSSHHPRQHHQQPEHEQNQHHHQSRATRPQAFQTSHPHSHSHLENPVVPTHLIALSPSHSSPQLTAGSGYQPSNVYTTKTSYRSQMYPTLTNRSQSSSSNQSEYDNMRTGGRLEGSLDSGFSSANNMYNITSQQKSHYDSTDRLKSPAHSVYDKTLTTKHGSLEGAYRKKSSNSGNNYGSLERNRKKKQDYSDNSGHTNDPRSHYGGKRESGSEYSDPETPTPHTGRRVEVPVHHETDESHYYTTKQFLYGDSFTSQDLSPLPPTSPRKEYTDVLREQVNEQSYSPRTYESSYARSERRAYSPSYEHDVSSSSINIKRIESQPSASKLVTVKQFQPHTEVSKPYELSDFYKYSERLRRQRQVDVYQKQLIGVDRLSRCSTPSQSSDGDYPSNTSHTSQPGSPYRGSTHTNYRNDYQQPYSPGPASPDISTSTSYHSVKVPGIQYSTKSKTVYKSHHIESGAPKHSSYQAPRPMTCQPVKTMYSTSPSPSPVPSRQDKDVISLPSSESTSSFTAPQSLVDGFSDEVLAWLDDQNTPQPPTLV